MDLIIGRGVKFSYFLFSRRSKCLSKLPSFLIKQQKACNYYHIQCLKVTSSCQSNNVLYNRCNRSLKQLSLNISPITAQHGISTKSDSGDKLTESNKDGSETLAAEKPSVFQRMKQMTKDYWHILIPVHIVTSIGWAGMFYAAAKNGVDIIGVLESLNLSEKYLEMVRGSSAGHWAVTYALYKIATPARYTVTLGGTTMCIRYLNKLGLMKFKDSKLNRSLKSAQEHVQSKIKKSNIPKKANKEKLNDQPPPKT